MHIVLDVISATFASLRPNMCHTFRSLTVLVSYQAHLLTRCQDLLDFEHVLRPELTMDRLGCHHGRLPLAVLSLEAAHLISSHQLTGRLVRGTATSDSGVLGLVQAEQSALLARSALVAKGHRLVRFSSR